MKIVFVLPDMPGGGSERVVSLLANEFVKRKYEVAILLFAGNQVAYPLNEKVEIVIAGEESDGNPLVRIKRLWAMRRFYKANKGCYIFSFCVMGTVFSVLAAAGIPHRLLVSERNDPTRIPHQKLRNWAYRKAEKLVFQTEDMKKCFPKDIRDKSVVIPNPVAENILDAFYGERQKKIVSVARLQPQKNQKLLINAFADFCKTTSEFELHIYGVGELEQELRNQIQELGMNDKIFLKGFSNHVMEEIRNSMMFVLSSDYEGIPNSMIEALALGIPVISTDCPVGGPAVYIESGVSGILVPVGDAKAMAQAMERIASDTAYAEYLAENGKKIKEKFSLKKIADRFLAEAGI